MLRSPLTEKWVEENARKMNAYFMDDFRNALRIRGFINIDLRNRSPDVPDDRIGAFRAGVELARSCPKDHQIFWTFVHGEYHIYTAESEAKLLEEIQHVWHQVSDSMKKPFLKYYHGL